MIKKEASEHEIVKRLIKQHYQKEGPKGVRIKLTEMGIERTKSHICNVANDLDIRHRDSQKTRIIKQAVRKKYKKRGVNGVAEFLRERGIEVSLSYIGNVASRLGLKRRDPKSGKTVRAVVKNKYAELGPKGTVLHLKEEHGIKITQNRVESVASEEGIKFKNEKKAVTSPKLELHKFPDPPVLEIPREAWEKPGGRVGSISRIDWKNKGARAALVLKSLEIAAAEGCHYNCLNGGLVDKRHIETQIKEALAKLSPAQKKVHTPRVIDHELSEYAKELHSIIPLIKKPPEPEKPDRVEFVRLYLMTSLILDGKYGERVGQILQDMRPDIRLYKQGGDRTRFKGIGATEEEKRRGVEIEWLNPKKNRIPGQYASTAVDKEISEEEAGAENYPAFRIVGGFGSSISKPGGGERKIAYISLPVLHVPLPRRPGEPSLALNQVGVRIVKVSPDAEEWTIQTWSLRDLVVQERNFVTGIKEGATELHKKIVGAIKQDRKGLHIGELSDTLGVDREEIARAVEFLVEPKALRRTTWPGLYKDVESGRYNLHLDWFQERLRYPWDYSKDYLELRRLIFGCMHAGYNTTDYQYIRHRLPEIILRLNIEVVELVGDIVAGLKHHLIHRGQIIGHLNYTDQEIFAAELLGTVFYDVFVARFNQIVQQNGRKKPNTEELDNWIKSALVLFLYIVGNHDAWQKEEGHSPGVTFRDKLITLLNRNLGKFLAGLELYALNLDDIVRAKMVELPEFRAVYTFPGGICTELLHPSMSRTKTVSIRVEEAFNFSSCQLVDMANFHTTFQQDKWDPDLGQRVGCQAGAMTPLTYFEHGKLKRIDFGPVYVGVRYKNGKIFMSEHQFFNKPLLKTPLDENMNVNRLKEELGLLRSPV